MRIFQCGTGHYLSIVDFRGKGYERKERCEKNKHENKTIARR